MYPAELLDYNKYMEQNQCPVNDQLCDETVWLTQNLLLGTKEDMDDIIASIEKIQPNADKIARMDNLVQRAQGQDYELRY